MLEEFVTGSGHQPCAAGADCQIHDLLSSAMGKAAELGLGNVADHMIGDGDGGGGGTSRTRNEAPQGPIGGVASATLSALGSGPSGTASGKGYVRDEEKMWASKFSGMRMKRFLTPKQLSVLELEGHYPEGIGVCLLCQRSETHSYYYAFRMEGVDAEFCCQRHRIIMDEPGEYPSSHLVFPIPGRFHGITHPYVPHRINSYALEIDPTTRRRRVRQLIPQIDAGVSHPNEAPMMPASAASDYRPSNC